MTAEVISFRPTDAELEAAWEVYDEAQRRVVDMYRSEGGSTAAQRRAAVVEADRLHAHFKRLCERAEAR